MHLTFILCKLHIFISFFTKAVLAKYCVISYQLHKYCVISCGSKKNIAHGWSHVFPLTPQWPLLWWRCVGYPPVNDPSCIVSLINDDTLWGSNGSRYFIGLWMKFSQKITASIGRRLYQWKGGSLLPGTGFGQLSSSRIELPIHFVIQHSIDWF